MLTRLLFAALLALWASNAVAQSNNGAIGYLPSPVPGIGSPPQATVTSAYYVSTATNSPAGSDSNAGTLAAPFLTLTKCQTAMQATNNIRTCYLRAGTYALASIFTLSSNEAFSGYPGDPFHSATLTANFANQGIYCGGCTNIYLTNLTFSTGPNATTLAWLWFELGANNIHVENNLFTGTGPSEYMQVYNSNNVYFRGNTISPGNTTNNSNGITYTFNTGLNYYGHVISDNVFSGCNRFCVEYQTQTTTGGIINSHVDRNVFSNFEGPHSGCGTGTATAAISFVGSTVQSYSQNNGGNTVWGNVFNTPSNANNCIWDIEIAAAGVSVENNMLNYPGAGMSVGVNIGTEIENNTFNLSGSNTSEPSGGALMFTADGGYNQTEWIGNDTVNGTVYSGCTVGTATWCNLTTPPVYAAQPAVYTPSPIYSPPSPPPVAQTATVPQYISITTASATTATASVATGTPGWVTWTGNVLQPNDPVYFAATGNGFTLNTPYYVIGSSLAANGAGTFTLATSITNAIAGTAITATGTASGLTLSSGVFLTTATSADLTAITLNPGSWLICNSTYFKAAASTVTTLEQTGISTVANTLPTPPAGGYAGSGTLNITGPNVPTLTVGCTQQSVTTPTTFRSVAQASFTVSTDIAYGTLTAELLH